MLIGYGDRKRTYEEVSHLFNDLNPQRPPVSRSTVSRIMNKFNETGSVQDRPRSGRPKTATNEDKTLDVLLDVQQNPQTSTYELARNHGISRKSVQTILHKNKFHPYKIQNHHELNEDDFDRRLQFCESILQKISTQNNFLDSLVFSDEATFCLNGTVNRHNCRYWSDSNPHWMDETHTQYPQKVNVWAGLVQNHLIGPFFIDGALTGEKYLDLLQHQIIPEINNLFPNMNVYFQQDGAPAHYHRIVREYLDTIFPQRWIGRRGVMEWPARSPDMTPLDFFLWGYLKNRVYVNRPSNINDLKARIRLEMQSISPQMINSSIRSFQDRLYYCQETGGQQFEHLL